MNNFINNFVTNEFRHSLIINEEEILNLNVFEEFLRNLKGFLRGDFINDNVYKIVFENINREEFNKNSTLINRILRRGI